MALPNPIQVAGKHNAVYELYYKHIDPKETGGIEAMVAAKFLKKSGLSDVVLSRIWDLSDPSGKGYLDKSGFYVSLKLVALAQAGQTINMANIFTETQNPPKVGEIPKPLPQRVVHSVPPTAQPQGDWSIKVIDRLKYEQLFESLKPVNGFISGNKVKGVLMESKLPMDTLGKIWDLADQDRDGNLDKHEFIVAMHLVYQTLDKRVVPDVLPPELQRGRHGAPPPHPPPPSKPAGDANGGFVANFPTDIAPPPVVPPLPAVVTQPQPIRPPSVGAVDWVVTPAEMQKFEIIFRDSDRDKDGLVSGLEIKNVFLQSGVQQNCLAHIWALCDTNQSGKLTLEQFALAMWFVERKKVGIEPPQALAPNMIPPSMRGVIPGVDVTPQVEPKPQYTNPELEMISKEIEELAKERRILETDIAQKEADIRIKSGEVRSLQSELDTLSATLKQLEHQKGEAQKRLDDLKNQKSEFDLALEKINEEVNFAKNQVNKIRDQCTKQEETIIEQESELNSKKSELQKLKDEEMSLEKEYSSNQKELDDLTKKLQDTQLEISQVRSMVTQLLEAQRQMTDALLLCRAAVEANDAVIVSDYSLQIQPDFDEAKRILEKKPESPKKVEEVTSAFSSSATSGFTSDPFGSSVKSGFDDSFNAKFDDAFGGSSFSQQDAFAADPFGDKSTTKTDAGKDDFGSDPFASLHAPTGQGQVLSPNTQKGPPPRPESPSPALPPKKSKQPPPRPAPPRPLQAPQPQTDAFGTSPSGGFADFADFDNKQASSVFGASTTSLNSTSNSATTNTNTTTKPTDFSDDPFKDYRYEDPFSIKDPFDSDDDEETSKAFFPEPTTKSPRTTPIGAVDNNNFANFDAFSPAITAQTTTTNNIKNNNNNDSFFDAFNDNFNSNLKTTSTNKFDAFGDAFSTATTIATKSSGYKVFDENENGFEDDFFKMKLSDKNNGTSSVNSKKSKKSSQNNVNSAVGEKIADKFADDYSKTDSFDADLAEALKRSMAEK